MVCLFAYFTVILQQQSGLIARHDRFPQCSNPSLDDWLLKKQPLEVFSAESDRSDYAFGSHSEPHSQASEKLITIIMFCPLSKMEFLGARLPLRPLLQYACDSDHKIWVEGLGGYWIFIK